MCVCNWWKKSTMNVMRNNLLTSYLFRRYVERSFIRAPFS